MLILYTAASGSFGNKYQIILLRPTSNWGLPALLRIKSLFLNVAYKNTQDLFFPDLTWWHLYISYCYLTLLTFFRFSVKPFDIWYLAFLQLGMFYPQSCLCLTLSPSPSLSNLTLHPGPPLSRLSALLSKMNQLLLSEIILYLCFLSWSHKLGFGGCLPSPWITVASTKYRFIFSPIK